MYYLERPNLLNTVELTSTSKSMDTNREEGSRVLSSKMVDSSLEDHIPSRRRLSKLKDWTRSMILKPRKTKQGSQPEFHIRSLQEVRQNPSDQVLEWRQVHSRTLRLSQIRERLQMYKL